MACVGAFNKAATSGKSQAATMLGALTEAIEPRRATRPANSSAVCDTSTPERDARASPALRPDVYPDRVFAVR
jgi:hypothetical protein